MRKRTITGGGCLVVAALALAAAPTAPAKDGDVRAAGTCSRGSTAKIKLSDEDGRIEVEFEVDQNRVGVRWAVRLRQNGRVVSRTTKVTRAPSGSFEARMVVPNRAGADRFVATATRRGEICRAQASL
jgi:hypothetical protein